MKKMLKSGWLVSVLLTAVVCMVSISHADTIATNQVTVKSNEVETTYDFDEVNLKVQNGVTKVSICKCLSFRSLQLLATQFSDGVIPRDDIKVYAAYTSTPSHKFCDIYRQFKMGMRRSFVMSRCICSALA